MSRQPPADEIQEFTLLPPVRGRYTAKRAFDNAAAAGRCRTFNFLRANAQTVSLIEGNVAFAAQSNFNVSVLNNKVVFSYKSATRDDIVYVNGQDLRVFDVTSLLGVDALVAANVIPADTQERMGYVRFRGKVLISTTTNGLWWYDGDTRTARKAGVVAPAAQPTGAVGAGGSLTGDYKLVYTFVNDQGHESNPSPASATVTATADKIDWATIAVGATGTASRRLYRTTASGATYLFLTTIADNVTTTYTDDVADAALGAEVDSDNTVPPTNIRQILASQSRVFLVDMDGQTVWASKIDATTGLPNWESFPAKLSIALAFSGGVDKAKAGIFYGGDIFAFGGFSVAQVIGDVATGIAVQRPQIGMGLLSPFAWCVTPKGMVFMNNSREMRRWNGVDEPENIGWRIQGDLDLFYTETSLTGPALSYDPAFNCVYLSAKNALTQAIQMESLEWFTPGWTNTFMHIAEHDNRLIGVYDATCTLRGSFDLGLATAGGAPVYDTIAGQSGVVSGQIEYWQWSPSPGDDIEWASIEITIKAKPYAFDGTPPLLTVEWGFDGSRTNMRKQIFPFLKPFFGRFRSTLGENPDRTIVIEPNRTAKYLNLRLTTGTTYGSAIGGVEISRIAVNVKVLNQTQDAHRSTGGGNQNVFR